MSTNSNLLADLRWLMDVVHSLDVGLVVLDKNFNIKLWNSFMQNHSALGPEEVINQNLFEVFPEVDEEWFRRKAQTVYILKNSAFTTWEQRPYLFRFENYRPITGAAEFMYQNSTLVPIQNLKGEIDSICIILYDVTEQAVSRKQLETLNKKLEVMSKVDGLTGLLNRKSWEDMQEKAFERYDRYGEGASLIIFDIDHFKKVNDTYGHLTGDEVIRQAASVVTKTVRKVDVCGRYGGEEYVILLPHTQLDSATILAERIRKKVAALQIDHEGHRFNVTISLGVAEVGQGFEDAAAWLDGADQCLYESKAGGRNRVTTYPGKSGA